MTPDQREHGRILVHRIRELMETLASSQGDPFAHWPELRSALADLERLFGKPSPEQERTREHGVSAHPRILIVEDNLFSRQLMTRLMERSNYQVEQAENGLQALEILSKHPIDLVLMDLKMPEMDGWTATRLWREKELNLGERSRLPIIAVTALAGEAERDRALEAGMDAFHTKPVMAEQLFTEMERFLQTASIHAGASQAPSPAKTTVFDLDAVLRSLEGDWELFCEVVDLFLGDLPGQLQSIADALATGDSYRVYDVAHTIKGASGAFGKTRVYETALALESLGRKEELEQAPPVFDRLRMELEILREALQNAVKEGNRQS